MSASYFEKLKSTLDGVVEKLAAKGIQPNRLAFGGEPMRGIAQFALKHSFQFFRCSLRYRREINELSFALFFKDMQGFFKLSENLHISGVNEPLCILVN